MDMHKGLAHFIAGIMLCGLLAPVYAWVATGDPAPPASSVIQAKSFRIIGSKAFPETELLKLVNDALGKELSSADIAALAIRITSYYRAHGFQHAHAILPKQNFSNGEIRFLITKSVETANQASMRIKTSAFPPKNPSALPEKTEVPSTHAAVIKASGFRIIGSRAYTEAELLPLVSNAIGKTLTSKDLDSLAQRITDFYRQHGFQRARAVVYTNTFDGSVAHALEGEVRFLITKLPLGAAVTSEQATPPAYLSVPNTIPDSGDPASVLLRRATWWISRDRDDLARETLNKLFSISPNYPDGLAALAELEIKMQKMDSAQTTLNTLRQVHPGHSAISRLEDLIRINGRDRDKLRHARQLAQQSRLQGHSGETEKALAEFRKLYPDGPPDGDLALEYWKLIAETKYGWKPAHLGLSHLLNKYPDNQRYRLALAEHESTRNPAHVSIDRHNLRIIVEIAKTPEYQKQAKAVWRYVLLRRPISAEDLPLIQEYLAFDPNDSAVKDRLRTVYQVQETHRKLMSDPAYRAGIEGTSLSGKGNFIAAEPLLEQALKAHPNNPDWVGEMGLLRMRQGHNAQAQELFAQALRLTHGASNKWKSLTQTSQFWQLMQESREARNEGKIALAKNKLYAALRLDPNEPNAIASLAQLQNDDGQVNEAEHTYKQALFLEPTNSSALEGLLDIFLKYGRESEANQMIANLTPGQRNVLATKLKRLETDKLQQQADSLLEQGQDEKAIALLEKVIQLEPDDPWLRLRLAKQYTRRHNPENGLVLFDEFLNKHPNDPDGLYALAQYQSSLDETGHALATLAKMEPAQSSEKITLFQQELRASQLRQQVKLLLADARAFSAKKEWASMQTTYQQVLKLDSANSEARDGLIESLIDSGDRAGALRYMNEWVADSKDNDLATRLKLTGLFIDFEEYSQAEELVNNLLAAYPNNSRALGYAAKIAGHSERLDDEIDYLKKSIAAEQAELIAAQADPVRKPELTAAYEKIGVGEFGSSKKINRDWQEKKLSALIDRRSRWLSSAIDIRSRSGTAGMSQLNSVETPVEYKTPWHQNDEVLFRVDEVKLNAGYVDPTNTSFGSQLLCPSGCSPALSHQSRQGVSLTVGYERENLRADIGVTPPNFPVSNVVGGIRRDGDLGKLSYSIEASRRPVTSSLLSYAGTQDPRTGIVWGGVVASGGRLGLSLDEGKTFGLWSTASLQELTGRNVQSNERMQFMAGGQWRLINEENRLFSVGLTGMYLHDANDAGEYTFGHGGYFSPQNYTSLSLPITFEKRYPRFSYILRASVSTSKTQNQAAPYFPTDSAMQANASASATPFYSASISHGSGYSLKGAWEYQVEPKLFVGGVLSIDRSDSYSPNRVLFYLRYSLDHSGAQPVFLPPEPIEPSSQR
jgi:Tfp pilus assembly protein PilF